MGFVTNSNMRPIWSRYPSELQTACNLKMARWTDAPATTSTVILRVSGGSSTPRAVDVSLASLEYWIARSSLVKPGDDDLSWGNRCAHFSKRAPQLLIHFVKQPIPVAPKRPAARGARAFAGTSRPRDKEGAGNAAMPRGARGSCAKKAAVRTRGSARHRIIRHSPRNGFTVYRRALLGEISSIATVAFGLTVGPTRLSRTHPPKT